jgi:hypothetical protein
MDAMQSLGDFGNNRVVRMSPSGSQFSALGQRFKCHSVDSTQSASVTRLPHRRADLPQSGTSCGAVHILVAWRQHPVAARLLAVCGGR